MATIDRASLLQEFQDTTSARLLKQPEPPYIYTRLWMDALMATPPSVDSLGRPGDAFGMGDYASFDEQMAAVEQNVFKEAFEVVQEIGKKPGHTVRLNRPAFTNSTYTLASRRIPSGSTISTTGLSVTSEQVSLTLERFGGPYGTSEVQPLSIERFDAMLSIHGMAKLCDMHLVRDLHKWQHYVIATLLDLASTSNNVFPGNKTATTDFVTAGDGPMSWDMVLKTARILSDASIPTFSNGKWAMVLNPRQVEQLSGDPAYQRLSEFHPGFNSLFQGSYVKTAGDFNIFRTPALNTGTNATPEPDVTYYKGHAFGPGILGSGVGDMPRVARSNVDNFGETDLIIWLLYSAYGLLDNRFGAVIYTD
jgi:hypothetical protein